MGVIGTAVIDAIAIAVIIRINTDLVWVVTVCIFIAVMGIDTVAEFYAIRLDADFFTRAIVIITTGAFGKSSLTFILNLPGEAQESNASSQSEDKLRLEWNFLLKENTTGPMPMTARAALPASKPPWLFLLAILPLVFFVQNLRSREKLEQ